MNKKYLLLVSSALLLASCGTVNASSNVDSSSEIVSESSVKSEEESKSESSVAPSSSSSEKQVIYVSSITVDNAPTTMYVDDTLKLEVSVLPENADNNKVTYSSSNPSVADVSRNTLSAYAPGKATITITAADGSGVSASFEVTVKAKVVAPDTWDKAKASIENATKLASNVSGYTYKENYKSYQNDGSDSNSNSSVKNYVYSKDGNAAYTGVYKSSASSSDVPLAGWRGVVDNEMRIIDHAYQTYSYKDIKKAIGADLSKENAYKETQYISDSEPILKYVSEPSKWGGDKTYIGNVEDEIIKIKYSHSDNGYATSYKGSLEATLNAAGELLTLTLKDEAYYEPDFVGLRYTYEYTIEVDYSAKADTLPVSVSDFYLTENYTNIVRTYGSKEDNVAIVGNYIQFEGREKSQIYAIDYLQENFEIVSSSNVDVIGKKKETDTTYYALSEGTSTLTIKRKSTGETKNVVVTSVRPEATSFDTVISSEGINMNVGKTTKFTASLKPTEASQDFIAKSGDESIMRVYQQDGEWYGEALKAGEVTITFTTESGLATPKTLTLTISEAPAEAPKWAGTWKSGSNTMVLEANGNGKWNEYSFTFTYNESTKKGTMSNFGAFDDDENEFTYSESKGTISVYLSGDYGDNVYNTEMTKVVEDDTPSTPTKSQVGTWKSGSITMVLEANGNGTWEGYHFTYSYNETTHKATMSNFAAFDDDENEFTYNPDNDTISVHVSGDYGDNVFNATFSRA